MTEGIDKAARQRVTIISILLSGIHRKEKYGGYARAVAGIEVARSS